VAKPRQLKGSVISFDNAVETVAALLEQAERLTRRSGGMVSLEMLAFTNEQQSYPVAGMEAVYGRRGDFIALVANAGAGRHIPTKLLPVPSGGRAIPDMRLSDHSPFWDAGTNALMVTDTSLMRNPHDHQMSDTVETLDLPFFAAVVEGLDAAMRKV
jgi:hypothetical protein